MLFGENKMIRFWDSFRFKSFVALAACVSLFLCACNTVTPASETENTETLPAAPTSGETSETTLPSGTTTAATTTENATSATTETEPEETGSDETEENDETEETEITETSETGPVKDIGYGSYGFKMGNLEFHSQNDISMMIQPEDSTIYDFGARKCACSWIDAYYYEDAFDMTVYDATYRFLGFYNEDTSINFAEYKELGPWTTPKGSQLTLYLTDITIISDNLVIHILPANAIDTEHCNISICGRGYYATKDQLQMADVALSALMENPGVDPFEGVVSGTNHTYYF